MSTDYSLLRTLLQLSRTRVDPTEDYITECTRYVSSRVDKESEDDRWNIYNRLDRTITNKNSK